MVNSKYWIGEFYDGELVIFAPELQCASEREWVYLWSYETKKIDRYDKKTARNVIRKPKDMIKAEKILNAFIAETKLKNWENEITKGDFRYIIRGPWSGGAVIDFHTTDSKLVGEDQFGHPKFENTYSKIGGLLHEFKYKHDQNSLNKILEIVSELGSECSRGIFDLIVPVPPSEPNRTVTCQLAQGLSKCFSSKYSDTALLKIRSTSQLKSEKDPDVRRNMLVGVFQADPRQVRGKNVLLVDDLYRSGATLESATEAIMTQGQAQAVYVLAITRTRVHR